MTTKKKIKCEPSTRPNGQIEKQQEHTDRDIERNRERATLTSGKCVFFLNELHFMQLIAATKIAFKIGMHLHFCNRVLMLLEIKLCKICYNSTTEFVGWFSFPLFLSLSSLSILLVIRFSLASAIHFLAGNILSSYKCMGIKSNP